MITYRDWSRAAATSRIERFVIVINYWKPLTIITKRSILDVAAALDPPLIYILHPSCFCEIWALYVLWITYDHYITLFSWCIAEKLHLIEHFDNIQLLNKRIQFSNYCGHQNK